MSDEIKKQKEVVLEAWSELRRIARALQAEVHESPTHEWEALRDMEQKAFEAWRVEDGLLRKMKEEQNEIN
jgi:hypothetical protein